MERMLVQVERDDSCQGDRNHTFIMHMYSFAFLAFGESAHRFCFARLSLKPMYQVTTYGSIQDK